MHDLVLKVLFRRRRAITGKLKHFWHHDLFDLLSKVCKWFHCVIVLGGGGRRRREAYVTRARECLASSAAVRQGPISREQHTAAVCHSLEKGYRTLVELDG